MNKQINRSAQPFFTGFIVWFFGLFGLILAVPTLNLFVWVNQHRHPISDIWWTVFTAIGDGVTIVLIAATLFFFNKKYLSMGVLGSYLLSGLVVRIIKKTLALPRPANLFEGVTDIYTASWFTLHHHQSMPSGHTTSVFAAATFLVLALHNKLIASILLLTACLVGYSRVYLGQHFVHDVWVGSYIGVICGIIIYRILRYYSKVGLDH